MKELFYEFLFVLASSPRTVWAIVLGPVLCLLVLIIGEHMTSNIEFSGHLKLLEEVIGEKLMRRYDRVAIGTLISFWVLAYNFYKKDKKRFDKYF